jgi:hypothetical protein
MFTSLISRSSSKKLFPILLIGFFVGVFFSSYIFSLEYINGDAVRFLWPEGDNQAYATAQKLFAYGHSTFPIFNSDLFIRDAQQSLVYSDFIPIFALIFKIINRIFSSDLNHLVFWTLLIFPFQSLSFSFLLYSLKIEKLEIVLLGSIFSILIPIFLYRVGHLPLLGQFLIILSLAFYFLPRIRNPNLLKEKVLNFYWTLLIFISLWTNLYIAFMVLVIYAAHLGDLFIKLRTDKAAFDYIKKHYVYILLPFLIIFPSLWVAGFLLPYQTGYDYGFHSMNILSPFYPSASSLFRGFDGIYDPTGGQYEGYNYLGGGLIFLIIVNYRLVRKNDIANLNVYLGLIFGLLFLLFFSLTSKIYFGHIQLTNFHYPKFFGIFRSSGRMFWPISYLLLAISIYSITKRTSRFIGFLLIFLALAIQFLDTKNLLQGFYDSGHQKLINNINNHKVNYNKLDILAAHYDGIYITPDFHCLHNDNNYLIGDFAYAFAKNKKMINTFYLARAPIDQDCNLNINKMKSKYERKILPIAIIENKLIINKSLSCIDSPYSGAKVCTLPEISKDVFSLMKPAFDIK